MQSQGDDPDAQSPRSCRMCTVHHCPSPPFDTLLLCLVRTPLNGTTCTRKQRLRSPSYISQRSTRASFFQEPSTTRTRRRHHRALRSRLRPRPRRPSISLVVSSPPEPQSPTPHVSHSDLDTISLTLKHHLHHFRHRLLRPVLPCRATLERGATWLAICLPLPRLHDPASCDLSFHPHRSSSSITHYGRTIGGIPPALVLCSRRAR
jgi:hypothetical protein